MTSPTDPQHRALAELVHQLRPAWNRGGILGAIHAASGRLDTEHLVRAAIDAALDRTALTPAVIAHRDGSAWAGTAAPATANQTPSHDAVICPKCRRANIPGETHVCRPHTHPTELIDQTKARLRGSV
jgi:hypothetical protein